MTQMTGFDRRLGDWLDASGPAGVPDGLLERALAEARTRRQPRVWLPILQRDFPMQTTLRISRAPAIGWLVLVALIIVAAFAAALALGAFRRPPAPPFGLAGAGPISFDSNGDIVTARADGSGRVTLTSGADTDTTPTFSPDGTRIAFWRVVSGSSELAVGIMRADGTDVRLVTLPTGATPESGAPSLIWSPDSKRIALSFNAPGETDSSVWTIDTDALSLARIAPSGSYGGSPTWAPDGTRLAFITGSSLEVAPIDGSSPIQLSNDATAQATWQPNGDLIAFMATGVAPHIHVVRSDGTNERAVAADNEHDEYTPTWSPDGTRLAFIRNMKAPGIGDQAQAVNRVVVAAPDRPDPLVLDPISASGLNPVTLDGGDLVWAPDGASLAAPVYFIDSQQDQDVIVFDAATGTRTTIIPAPGNVGLLGWQRLAR